MLITTPLVAGGAPALLAAPLSYESMLPNAPQPWARFVHVNSPITESVCARADMQLEQILAEARRRAGLSRAPPLTPQPGGMSVVARRLVALNQIVRINRERHTAGLPPIGEGEGHHPPTDAAAAAMPDGASSPPPGSTARIEAVKRDMSAVDALMTLGGSAPASAPASTPASTPASSPASKSPSPSSPPGLEGLAGDRRDEAGPPSKRAKHGTSLLHLIPLANEPSSAEYPVSPRDADECESRDGETSPKNYPRQMSIEM